MMHEYTEGADVAAMTEPDDEELFAALERDARRYNRAFDEEEEASAD